MCVHVMSVSTYVSTYVHPGATHHVTHTIIILIMLYSIDSGGVFTTEIRSGSDYTEGLWNSLLMIWGMGKTITFGTGA